MLTKAKKQEVVREFSDKLKRQKIAVVCDFHGVSVGKIQQLRRALKKNDGEYRVAKKTLMARALEESGVGLDVRQLSGELGIAFGYGDPSEPAKTLFNFGKENETFRILAGILSGRALSKEDVTAIAKLPAREVLLAQLAGALQGPLRGLVTVLGGNMRGLVTVLNQIQGKK